MHLHQKLCGNFRWLGVSLIYQHHSQKLNLTFQWHLVTSYYSSPVKIFKTKKCCVAWRQNFNRSSDAVGLKQSFGDESRTKFTRKVFMAYASRQCQRFWLVQSDAAQFNDSSFVHQKVGCFTCVSSWNTQKITYFCLLFIKDNFTRYWFQYLLMYYPHG